MRSLRILAALLFTGCAAEEEPLCDPLIDIDQDGLDDCAELELGTDPASDDSDGDGASDLEEVDCSSDPLDSEEVCYACGWGHDDPGDLKTTGTDVGDTISNIRMIDQCGDTVDLWDFAQEYHVMYMTAAW